MHLNAQKKVFAGQVENTKIDKKGKLLDNWQKYLKNAIGQENKKKKGEKYYSFSHKGEGKYSNKYEKTTVK